MLSTSKDRYYRKLSVELNVFGSDTAEGEEKKTKREDSRQTWDKRLEGDIFFSFLFFRLWDTRKGWLGVESEWSEHSSPWEVPVARAMSGT